MQRHNIFILPKRLRPFVYGLLLTLFFPALSGFSQTHFWVPVDTLRAGNVPQQTRVYPHQRNGPSHLRANSSQFIVKYAGLSAAEQNAFQYALGLWSNELFTTVPISIEVSMAGLGAGVLGTTSINLVQLGNGSMPVPTAYYPSALRNQYEGCDLIPAEVDIQITLNNTVNWYLGTDMNTGITEFDFVSVVMHELGHGLGFAGTGNYDDGIGATECSGITGDGCIGLSGPSANYLIYDQFIENGLGVTVTSITNPSAGMGNVLTGDDIFWNGANGQAANLGVQPKLYAPVTFQSGSSYSHLDETTFPAGNAHSLMTPSISAGEAVHDIGNIARGMLQDIGWTLANTPQVRFTTDAVGYTNIPHDFSDASALASSWAWDFNNDGTPDAVAQDPTHLFATPGSYPIRLIINGNPSLGTSETIEIFDPPVVPFIFDFETSGSGLFARGFSCENWEWTNGSGKPNYSGLPSPTFGSNSWFTRASGFHGASSLYYLESPPINMNGAVGDYFLEFDYRGVVSTGAGMNVEYSVDGGNVWQVLGPTGTADPNAINDWYDVSGITGLSGEMGWSPGPLQVVTEYHPNYRINVVKGFQDVRFRFKFGSDTGNMFDGFQIDNFEINGSVLDAQNGLLLSGTQSQAGQHFLEWEDSYPEAGVQYTIERKSLNGTFIVLAHEAGTAQKRAYQFTDRQPFPGENIYRIKKTISNGQQIWSDALSLTYHPVQPFRLYPNPATTTVQLDWLSENGKSWEISLLNQAGQQVFQQTLQGKGWQRQLLDLSQLSPGIYLYRMVGEGKVYQGKLVRNHP